MNRAAAFGRAGWVERQAALSAISYDMYRNKPEETDPDRVSVPDFERCTLFKMVETDSRLYASFPHLGLAGYSSAYYNYMWAKVIAEDFFEQFDHKNLLAGPAPMRYRRVVLEPGGSMSANDLVKNFLGRPQNMDAFRKWVNQEFDGSSLE